MISKDGAGIEGTDFQIFSVSFLVSRELPTPPKQDQPISRWQAGGDRETKTGCCGQARGFLVSPSVPGRGDGRDASPRDTLGALRSGPSHL